MNIDRKGQMLSLEQMLLFSVGLIIAISIFLTFSWLEKEVRSRTFDDQLREVGLIVQNGINRVSSTKGFSSDMEFVYNIPEKLNDRFYTMEVDKTKVRVKSGDTSVDIPLSGANSTFTDIKGFVSSSRGMFKISYDSVSNIVIVSR
ncbi:MAG: hypothetical protein DRP11_02475 [Candidatus Aenigmatarchaeota archaeon]|nr:MAG: hypothetical protein DRP11_02475 [Candidatus Aenigmarchaeota archaeon]